MDRVRSIMTAHDGTIWLASGTGVHRFTHGELIANGEEEGLRSTVVHKVFEDRQGRIWAGTSRGLSLHRPEVDRDPPHTLLKLVNNPGEAPSSGNVRILFAGLDKLKQTPAERLLFSYRLDGGPWSRFNSADFTALQKLGHGRH